MTDYFAEIIAYTLYLKQQSKPSFDTISMQYSELITASRNLVKHDQVKFETWEKGLFAVCAWVDEQILISDWQDKDIWQLNTLQKKYFETTYAGEMFFEVLDSFDPKKDNEIIEVYNTCIKLGFQGKNFNATDAKSVPDNQRASPQAIIIGEHKLFPDAYRARTDLRKRKKIQLNLSIVMFVLITVSILSVSLLSSFYKGLLNQQVAGYF